MITYRQFRICYLIGMSLLGLCALCLLGSICSVLVFGAGASVAARILLVLAVVCASASGLLLVAVRALGVEL
jgi:hypothetical protein